MAEAKLNREYAMRVLGVGALMVGMCVWSLYDGRVNWPRQNRLMEQVRPDLLSTNLTAEAWLEPGESGVSPLEAAFVSKGFRPPSKLIKKLSELKVPDTATDREALRQAQAESVTKILKGPVYSEHDLSTQFIQAAVTLAFGLWAFCVIGVKARKRYQANGDGLGGSGVGGRTVGYADITAIDWSKWDEKGIMKLTLKSGACLTLDGWHFAGMNGIADEILKHRPELGSKKS